MINEGFEGCGLLKHLATCVCCSCASNRKCAKVTFVLYCTLLFQITKLQINVFFHLRQCSAYEYIFTRHKLSKEKLEIIFLRNLLCVSAKSKKIQEVCSNEKDDKTN